jgi:hypothetical protein
MTGRAGTRKFPQQLARGRWKARGACRTARPTGGLPRGSRFASEDGHRSHEARALRLLGEVAARHDPPEHADGHYRDGLALAEELGMRPLVARCHLDLAKLHRRTGKQQQAEEHFNTATSMYRDMGMTYWLEKAEGVEPRIAEGSDPEP